MRTLGVITARGGSRRLPGKNLAVLGDRTLLAWAAESGGGLDQLCVTTDDEPIAKEAQRLGCNVVNRPAYLARHDTPSLPVVAHAAELLVNHDVVVLLQPTSPFRTRRHVGEALQMMEQTGADAVISVTDCAEEFAFQLRHASRLEALPKVVVPNGAVYAIRSERLRAGHNFYDGEVYGYAMPKDASIDIDTELDLEMARFAFAREKAA